MKRGTPDHPKVFHLMRVLACERATAVGLLELLWHFTARYAPRGDIGRWPDERIAAALDWNLEPTSIVSALTRSGWLDVHPSYRLVVHDWHEHADDWTKKHLKKQRLPFLSKLPRKSRLVQTNPDQSGTDPDALPCLAVPSLALPSPALPLPPTPAAATTIRIPPPSENTPLNVAILDACREIAAATGKDDAEVLKAHSMIPPRHEGERPKWITSLDSASEPWRLRTHQDLQAELSRLRAPPPDPSEEQTEHGLLSPEQWGRSRGKR